MARKTAAEIIAFHIGYDFAEMSDYRYQPSRWYSPAIYTVADGYWAAPTPANIGKLKSHYAGMRWEKVGEEYGRPIYRGVADEA